MDKYPSIQVVREQFGEIFVKGVRPLIEGVFDNILLNAVEAQSSKGRVGVWCRKVLVAGNPQTHNLDVFVCDDGDGLACKIREKISKGEIATTKNGASRGFGLVATRITLRECGGELQVLEDKIEGWKGACFKVTLPLA